MMSILKKLDCWINYCFKNDGWLGIFSWFVFMSSLYVASFWLPLSKFGRMYMFLLVSFSYFALVIGAMRLIKKKKNR
jgi:hypothetical protein